MDFVFRVSWKELVQVFRDRKLVFSTLVLPVLLMPVLMFGPTLLLGRLVQQTAEKRQEVAVAGLPEEALRALEAAHLVPVPVQDPEVLVREGKYPAGIAYRDGVYRVYARLSGGVTEGQVVAGKVQNALQSLKERKVAEALAQKGLPLEVLSPFRVEVVDAATEREKASGLLGFSCLSFW